MSECNSIECNSIEETHQNNKDVILNRAKDYYKNDKERFREQSRYKYSDLSQKEKNEKRKYGRNRYHNMFEEKKTKTKRISKTLLRLKNYNKKL